MINAHIIAIDQRVRLSDGMFQNFLVLELPDGSEARCDVSEETVDKILRIAAEGRQAETPVPSTPVEAPAQAPLESAVSSHVGLQPEAPHTVDWMALPDDVLPPRYKAAFASFDLAAKLTAEQIHNLCRDLDSKFRPEDWADVLGEKEEADPPQPVIGQVAWSSGQPIMQQAPSRTVQKNAMGYPVVRDGSIDPGEVLGNDEDADEDGVGQL